MDRILEPDELMIDDEQARAYAEANFDEPDSNFMRQFGDRFPDYNGNGLVLDLGCGPGNITWRFAKQYPQATLHGVDGSAAMLKYAYGRLENLDPRIRGRITLIEGFIPGVVLPARGYDVILSNSLLHHLPDPHSLWTMIRQRVRAGTRVFVADLVRPQSQAVARQIVETYSGDEPEVLKTDFYNSLCAAFTPAEIETQLSSAGLSRLRVETISDRHLLVYGLLDG